MQHILTEMSEGNIPFHKIGSNYRILAKNAVTYKEKIDYKRLQVLDELTELSQKLGYE